MKTKHGYFSDIDKALSMIPDLEKIRNRTILITGATGLICSAVVDMLLSYNREKSAGIKLILAGRNKEKTLERFKGEIITFIPFDSLSGLHENDLESVDYIIHGASNADPQNYVKEPVETFLGNIIGLNSLLSVALQKKARLLFISSSEIYGNNNGQRAYSENDYGSVGDILNPRSCYPNGKRGGETLCASYAAEYGLDFVIVRPGHIYGPTMSKKDSRASSLFIRNAVNGESIVMKSTGAQLRSYCYCVDCASAIISVLINGDSGKAYNISNKNSVITIRKFAEYVAAIGGVSIVFENPSDSEKAGYNLMSNSSLDATKLEFLGWRALFDAESGIRSSIDYLKKGKMNERSN